MYMNVFIMLIFFVNNKKIFKKILIKSDYPLLTYILYYLLFILIPAFPKKKLKKAKPTDI